MSETRWSIPIDRVIAEAQEDLEKKARYITLSAFNAVVLRSPVRTGRFRANWNASAGTPDYQVSSSTDASRGLAEASKAMTLPLGGVVYLSNALPYAQRLEYGYSKQAPQGMVRLTVLEVSQRLTSNTIA